VKVFGQVFPQRFGRFVAKANSNRGTDRSTTWTQSRILPSIEGPVYCSDAVDGAVMIWPACSAPTPRLIIAGVPPVTERWLELSGYRLNST